MSIGEVRGFLGCVCSSFMYVYSYVILCASLWVRDYLWLYVATYLHLRKDVHTYVHFKWSHLRMRASVDWEKKNEEKRSSTPLLPTLLI